MLWGYLHGLLAHVVEQGANEAASTGDQDEKRQLCEPLRAEQICDALKGQHALAPPADMGAMHSVLVKLPVTLLIWSSSDNPELRMHEAFWAQKACAAMTLQHSLRPSAHQGGGTALTYATLAAIAVTASSNKVLCSCSHLGDTPEVLGADRE